MAKLVCASCLRDAVINHVLGISFCPVHGLQTPLVSMERANRSYDAYASIAVPASWAVPTGA